MTPVKTQSTAPCGVAKPRASLPPAAIKPANATRRFVPTHDEAVDGSRFSNDGGASVISRVDPLADAVSNGRGCDRSMEPSEERK
jgi:hypothetical protein